MIKRILKKIRWKWHRDLLIAQEEKTDEIQASFRSICDTLNVSIINGIAKNLQASVDILSEAILRLQHMETDLAALIEKQNSLEQTVGALVGGQAALAQDTGAIMRNQDAMGQHVDALCRKADWENFAWRTECEKVFSLLADRTSQQIFWKRVAFSENEDLTPLFRYLIAEDRGDVTDIISLLRDYLNGKRQDELILFGTSVIAKTMFDTLIRLGIRVDYVCRTDDGEQFIHPGENCVPDDAWGIKTAFITEEELLDTHKVAQVIIGDVEDQKAKAYLTEKGFPEDRLWLRFNVWESQYLDPDIMKPHEHEVYVDGGVLDFNNTLEFIDWCHGNYDAVYAFEPDDASYETCERVFRENPMLDHDRIKLFKKALWGKNEEIHFRGGMGGGSTIAEQGENAVQGVTLDSVLRGKPITFLKLDVEGAEMQALYGARESIKKWRPRLAICIYHKPDDIVNIPLYIHGLVPEYKMYIRHYSTNRDETVLYCLCDDLQ